MVAILTKISFEYRMQFCNDLGRVKGAGKIWTEPEPHYHHQACCFNWHDYILIGMKKNLKTYVKWGQMKKIEYVN